MNGFFKIFHASECVFVYLMVNCQLIILMHCRETLTEDQLAWVRKTEKLVYSLLEETPPDGAKFVSTVRHILKVGINNVFF